MCLIGDCLFCLCFQYRDLFFPINGLPNHLVKSFVAYAALVCLLTRMGQSVIFVVSPLMETLSAELAYERLVPHMNSHVSIEG